MPINSAIETSPTDFHALMERIRAENRVSFSPELYMEVFAMDEQTFSRLAHVPPDAVRTALESERIQDYIRSTLRVLRAVADTGTDIGKAIYWLRNVHLSTFNDKTAEELVSEGRTAQLIDYLRSWEAGAQG
ncbi:DUF2384 domain-containing protein [Pseudomonas citronellolis]|uniref:DUF2384 domain-containing protein n=1 Tax=Pseudomonas citronellolis TaxID=53408 RepID=A0A1A9K5H0_9PSED|nr:hypothetical protein [Pseudomonas citronellolis]ANI12802.1 DUF2384 domain-containing protein [Pseudomonas citronellolis]